MPPINETLTPLIPKKIWIYTNYDCNLSCSYCVAWSTPRTPRRAINLGTVQRLIDEASALGMTCAYFTGGEPFLVPDIYEMLGYAAASMETTVLTNAMLFNTSRINKLKAVSSDRLIMQVSLDGANPERHDPYRGKGSWQRTLDGIRALQAVGFPVRISTTETPANSAHLGALGDFLNDLGIPAEDHFIRPLARRGFSTDGMEVGKHNLVPEMTVDVDGVYWHPLSTDEDMLVTRQVFPLADAYLQLQQEYVTLAQSPKEALKPFK